VRKLVTVYLRFFVREVVEEKYAPNLSLYLLIRFVNFSECRDHRTHSHGDG
jgi:hypothetical protein